MKSTPLSASYDFQACSISEDSNFYWPNTTEIKPGAKRGENQVTFP